MKIFQLLLFILLLILVSCEERFNGKDEESIKISREKIIKKLNQIERANLSKALDILTFEAYRLEGGKLNK